MLSQKDITEAQVQVMQTLSKKIGLIRERLDNIPDTKWVVVADATNPYAPELNVSMFYAVRKEDDGTCEVDLNGSLDYHYFASEADAQSVARDFKVINGHGQLIWRVVTEKEYLESMLDASLRLLNILDKDIK